MRALGQTFATLLFLVAIWGGGALIAWTMDALPQRSARVEPARDDGDAAVDTSVPARRGAAEPEAPPAPSERPPASAAAEPADGPPAEAPEPAEAVAPAAPLPPVRVLPLEAPLQKPYVVSLAAGDVLGDGRPELVVGLGERVEVLGVEPDGSLARRLVVHHRPANADTTPSSPRAAIGDATGDGVSDLVIAFWRRAHSLGSRGGGAWILRGKGDGTLDRPRRFAGPRMMISSVDLVDVDGREGAEIVLSDRGRPYGDIPGRIRVYRAARRPRPIADFSAETNDLRMVLPAHADDDGAIDLVAFGEAVVRFRNVGRGRFERMAGERKGAFFAGVYRGSSADLDRDGRLEAYAYPRDFETAVVIVEDAGFRSVPGTTDPMVRVVPGDGVPRVIVAGGVSQSRWELATLGVDGRLGQRNVVRQAGHRAAGSVIGSAHDAVVVDLDGDGALELVSLDTAWHEGQTEWQLAIGPLTATTNHTRGSLGGEPTSHEVR